MGSFKRRNLDLEGYYVGFRGIFDLDLNLDLEGYLEGYHVPAASVLVQRHN